MNETNAASFQDVALISRIDLLNSQYNCTTIRDKKNKSNMYHIHEQLTLECNDLFVLQFFIRLT